MLRVAIVATALAAASPATGTVSVAASLDDLVRRSSAVAVVTPLDARAEWQGRRIVTYHRLRVESLVSGSSPGGEVVVRTLGGRVGKIRQIVEGEAAFSSNERSLVFLRSEPGGALGVTARGQGQFRLRAEVDGRFVLVQNEHLGKLVAPRVAAEAASRTLHGAFLDAGVGRIVAVWGRSHAK